MNDRSYAPSAGRAVHSDVAGVGNTQNLSSLLNGTGKRLCEANALADKILDRLNGPSPVPSGLAEKGMAGVLRVADENDGAASALLAKLDQIASAIG